MRKTFLLLIIGLFIGLISCQKKRTGEPKVLLFSKTADYVHAVIPTGVSAFQNLLTSNNIQVDTTTDASKFNEENLSKYAAVIFYNTTGNVLDIRQEVAFERYIQGGGGFVGIHAAADTEYEWRWYGGLVGAYFLSHPRPQEARFQITDPNFAATNFLSDSIWVHTDELYNYKNINPDINVVMTIDESSYEGGENGNFHPISWYHEYDGGRGFYSALGHTSECYEDENYLNHILGGVQYAIGDNVEIDYSKSMSQYPPADDRFSKVMLSEGGFYEPTEMTILPNLDILVIQRRGEVMLYKHATKELKEIARFDVYFETLNTPGVNAEEGMLGLAKDPNFKENNWIYIFYSPSGIDVNRLSRFTFKDDILDRDSEVVILDVPSQREICCHTGGSIAFDAEGLLYVSTGDNSTPFNDRSAKYVNSGYAPLNDMPGKEQYDARRSAGNTNDLRGKILRIKVNEDGSYDIPDGNLFPVGTEKTRPEIYTMGHRNPYRITVDQKNGYLYWGDVGPDARNDSLATRGPRGYDEVGQARKAGNYGWPLFVADNQAYVDYDYETGESGEAYDPEKPINDSRNNTGLMELPPAQKAFIWYHYGNTVAFPQTGAGGRNAMAGPVYYTDLYPKETRLPDYYNGKLIIYDWVRGWMKAVTMKPNGDLYKVEPFFPDIKLNAMIDLEVGPDGKLYILEYGSSWFSKNPDSGLGRIDFNRGNRMPTYANFSINKTSGILPFTINASLEASDPEGGPLKFVWELGEGNTISTDEPKLVHTFNQAGDYAISVNVIDEDGGKVKTEIINVYAGNEVPKVKVIITGGNQSFYIPGVPVAYNVEVTDESDPSPFDPANLYVSVDYVQGYDQAAADLGHKEGVESIAGQTLVENLDCRACHQVDQSSVGPAYMKISSKYKDDPNALTYLSEKIINGGSGVWGEVPMAAHPDLDRGDLSQIVNWILSLDNDKNTAPTLPKSGEIIPPGDVNADATMVITASYTDKGGDNIKALTGVATASMKSNRMSFSVDDDMEAFNAVEFNGNTFTIFPEGDGWISLSNIDLTNVNTIYIDHAWRNKPEVGSVFELRLDQLDGKLIGKGSIGIPKEGTNNSEMKINIDKVDDGKKHKIYFIYQSQSDDVRFTGVVRSVIFGSK